MFYLKLTLTFLFLFMLTACSVISGGLSFSGEQHGSYTKSISVQTNELLLESKYFNEVKQVDGNIQIENPDNILALVNKTYGLPAGYEPNDLTVPNVEFSFGDEDVPKKYLRKEAADALEELFKYAKEEEIELYAVSGYRSYSRQQGIFNVEKEQSGEEHALAAVALPGKSEHQTGLAMDVTSKSVDLEITQDFGETKEGKWLRDNAHRAGFIIRYPLNKELVTEYQYEPWHIRYVGKEKATYIYENKLTLEEYFKKVRKI
ncbi:D-alanyl-D-alanine carboxypeptidase family protein [Bacillus sp. AFS040349]|uniref:M15 family metallopeptidase n=1 Tax=Bacillus sp. AFS040349 TaxID=2033502 RepID=UPI000BFE9810|nr:M15 family metallopeptidase [Bacillus sp. AFS040349]PGT78113.1 peptidase M15 [Bacillus sp. AFS040349]